MTSDSNKLLSQARERLRASYGDRLRGLVLYGSHARGNPSPESDIDLLVLLRGPVHLWEDIRRVTDALYPLQMEVDAPLAALPVDAEAYEAGALSLYRNAKREGVPA